MTVRRILCGIAALLVWTSAAQAQAPGPDWTSETDRTGQVRTAIAQIRALLASRAPEAVRRLDARVQLALGDSSASSASSGIIDGVPTITLPDRFAELAAYQVIAGSVLPEPPGSPGANCLADYGGYLVEAYPPDPPEAYLRGRGPDCAALARQFPLPVTTRTMNEIAFAEAVQFYYLHELGHLYHASGRPMIVDRANECEFRALMALMRAQETEADDFAFDMALTLGNPRIVVSGMRTLMFEPMGPDRLNPLMAAAILDHPLAIDREAHLIRGLLTRTPEGYFSPAMRQTLQALLTLQESVASRIPPLPPLSGSCPNEPPTEP